jgi:hypothetical protein
VAQLYHRLQHQKHKLLATCGEAVEAKRRLAGPTADKTKILNDLIEDEKWLEQVSSLLVTSVNWAS